MASLLSKLLTLQQVTNPTRLTLHTVLHQTINPTHRQLSKEKVHGHTNQDGRPKLLVKNARFPKTTQALKSTKYESPSN